MMIHESGDGRGQVTVTSSRTQFQIRDCVFC